MVVDPEAAQDVVDRAVESYEDKTILNDEFSNEPEDRIPHSDRRTAHGEKIVNIEDELRRINFERPVREVVESERRQFFDLLNTGATQAETIGDEFVFDIRRAFSGVSIPTHLYLPDKREYRSKMAEFGYQSTAGEQYTVQLHWIQSDYLDERTGYLIDDWFKIDQQNQGDIGIISDEIGAGPVPGDNQQNRLKVNIRRWEGGKLKFEFWSEFARGRNTVTEPEITELELLDL